MPTVGFIFPLIKCPGGGCRREMSLGRGREAISEAPTVAQTMLCSWLHGEGMGTEHCVPTSITFPRP